MSPSGFSKHYGNLASPPGPPCQVGYAIHLCVIATSTGSLADSISSQSSFLPRFSLLKLLFPTHIIPELFTGRDGAGLTWHDPLNSILDRGVFVLAIVLLSLTRRRLPAYIWAYCLVSLLV